MDCSLNVELLPSVDEIKSKPEECCPVDWALKAADTARLNNCGESVMCRDGMQQLYTIISDITNGKGEAEDIELLRDICAVIKRSEGCGIAKRTAELLDKSIELYPDEWSGHIRRKRCSARVCKGCNTAPVVNRPQSEDGTIRRRSRKRKSSDS